MNVMNCIVMFLLVSKDKDFYSSKAGETSSTCFLPEHKSLQHTSRTGSGNSGDVIVSSNNKVFRPSDNPYNLVVGSPVQYFGKYGIIKWMGIVPGDGKIYAKVEMVNN